MFSKHNSVTYLTLPKIKKTKILLILWLLPSEIFGQVAIINDKDGYTNVRENPDVKSKIIYKLQDNELFFFEIENSLSDTDWIKIYISKNKYSLDCGENNSLIGYIHKSRLKPIEELEKYGGSDFSFKYNLGEFNFNNKTIDYVNDKWISKINGRPYYGTDGATPRNEVLSLDVWVSNKKIVVTEILYQDLFEISNTFEIYRKDDFFFIQQFNSDGAGGYLLVWAIDNKSVRQRLIKVP